MNHLIIDTSTRQTWIALFNDRMSGCLHFEDRQSCLINLAPGIQQVLTNAGIRTGDLGCISTVVGPGTWSSLRIGLTTVKQLCLTNRIPLAIVTSSELLADYAHLSGITHPALLTALDAGGGKVYSALFKRRNAGYQQISPDVWQSVGDVMQSLGGISELAIIGDGANRFETFNVPGWQLFHDQPQANSRYLRLIADRMTVAPVYNADNIQALKPLYVQPSSAEVEFRVSVT